MKYGIIVCPKCKSPKVVNLLNKTTRCIRCGKILTLNKLQIIHKTGSEQELREYIFIINKKLDNSTRF
jgi:ribosomal protein L37AE/L43A